MSVSKVYNSTHKYNSWELKHHYLDGGKITRTWSKIFTLEGGIPAGSEMRYFQRDGSMELDDLLFDIEKCFYFTGYGTEHRNDEELHRVIYETQLPKGTEIITTEKVFTPQTYHELFGIIGVSSGQLSGEYLIWECRKDKDIQLEVKYNKIFYWYS